MGKDLIGPNSKQRSAAPDLARIAALAAEIHGVFSSWGRLPGVVLRSSGPLGALAGDSSQVLGAADLSGFFGTPRPAGPWPFCPDDLDAAAVQIENSLKKVREEIQGLEQDRSKLQGGVETWRAERAALEPRRVAAASQLQVRSDHLAARRKRLSRLEEHFRPNLAKLEKELLEHRDFFRRFEKVPGLEPPSGPLLARRKKRLYTAGLKFDRTKAGLCRRRAEFNEQASELVRCKLLLDRLTARVDILRRREETAFGDIGRVSERLSALGQGVAELTAAQGDVLRMRSAWAELKAELRLFYSAAEGLRRKIETRVNHDWSGSLAGIRGLRAEAEQLGRDWSGAIEALEKLGPAVDEARQGLDAVYGEGLALGRRLDEATLCADGLMGRAKDIHRELSVGVEKILERRRGLEEQGRAAVAELSGKQEEALARAEAAFHKFDELREFSLKASSEVRALASWERGAALLVEKLLDQMAQAWAVLPGLIGASGYLSECLRRGAVEAVGASRKLADSKSGLARIHDQFILPPGLRPVNPEPVAAQVGERLGLVKASLGRDEVFVRLPDQLTIFRQVLGGVRRLRMLEKEHQKSLEGLRRLEEDKSRLTGLLAKSRSRLDGLAEEKERLAGELSAAGKRTEALSAQLRDEAWPLAASLAMALRESHSFSGQLLKKGRESEEKLGALTVLAAELAADKKKAQLTSARLAQVLALTNLWDRKKDRAHVEEAQRLTAEVEAASGEARELEFRLKEQKAARTRELAAYKRTLASLKARSAVLEHGQAEAEATAENLARELDARTAERDRLAGEFKAREDELTGRFEEAREKADFLAERLKALEREFQKNRAELRKVEMSLAGEAKAKDEAGRASLLLGRALTLLAQDSRRRERILLAERSRLVKFAHLSKEKIRRLNLELQEEEARRLDQMNLVKRQAPEIQDQREQLVQLLPLLSFFMERIHLWIGSRTQAGPSLEVQPGTEFQAALVQVLALENEALKERLQASLEQRQGLAFENEHLTRSNAALKSRLAELTPVLSFFWNAWTGAAADLAGAAAREKALLKKIESSRRVDLARQKDLARLTADLARAEEKLVLTGEALAGAGNRVAELEATSRELEDILARTRTEAEAWRLDAGDKAGRLESAEWRDQIKTGRSEAALAGLFHLAEESRKIVESLQARSRAKSDQIAALEARLQAEQARTAELERRQDRLGLLFWVMAQAGGRPEAVDALVRLSRERGFRDAAVIAAQRLQDLSVSGMRFLGREKFQKAIGRSVRRGFLSLLLAGTMVVSVPQESSKAAASRTDLMLPPDLAAIVEKPSIPTGEMTAGTFYHPELGRLFDVGALLPWEKAKGLDEVEKLVGAQLDSLAAANGLEPKEYNGLIRRLYKPDQPAPLVKLKDVGRALEVLKNHFPNVAAAFVGRTPSPQAARDLYRLAGLTSSGECRFWDRLFADYLAQQTGAAEALEMVLANAGRNVAARDAEGPEFAGRLKPAPELEEMNLTTFVRVMTPYIKANVKSFTANRTDVIILDVGDLDEYSDRLARDVFFAARIFRVPLTLMVSIAHQESYFANILGDHAMSASPFQIYQPTKPYIIKSMTRKGLPSPGVPARLQDHLTLATYMAAFHMRELIDKVSTSWGRDKKSICDLDRVAFLYNGGETYPGAVFRKKISLVSYLSQVVKAGPKKKADRSS
ncbi:MAG: hypothetical protein V1816_27335 [Pseudomonadota bacterium]